MNKDSWKGFFAGVICCLLIAAAIACGADDSENRLTKKEVTPTTAPDVTLPPAKSLEETNYQLKVERLASVLDYYYYQDIDYNDIADGIYHGMVNGVGDPYTTYYNAKEFAAFQESSDGKYAGFGSRVTIGDNGYPLLTQVFENGPAYKAGIRTGDYVVEVDGESTYGVDTDILVTKMRGEVGSTVEVVVYREGEPDYITFTVIRDIVEIPTVSYEMLENNIGYISVLEFDEVTAQQFTEAVNDLTKQKMKALVVDLRGNPGGLLSTVKSMLSRIVEKGKMLVYMEDKNGRREEHTSDSTKTVDVPIAVLMNGYSASASEVFAGCLQDYGKAILVGTQSFGKGIVQTLYPLGDGTGIKLTVSAYYTPNGRNIHKTGLTPDILVELDDELKKLSTIPHDKDNQLKAAVDALMEKIGQ
ncbi:MAG: S41 family peptidase [Lachnospiraceae bacterium]|nr:S41 family peptidase [Lachnospiraceae bacterium]